MIPGRARRAAPALLALALLAACSGSPRAPADPGPFTLPQVDLGELPDLLRRQAREAEEKARAQPGSPAALGDLALLYLEYDFPLAAATCLERAAGLEPGALRWRYYLALAYRKAGDHHRTVQALESALAIDGDYAPALVMLGEALQDEDPGRAAKAFARAAEVSPGNAQARLGRGRLLQAGGDEAEAEAQYREAIRLAPGYAAAHYALAMLLASSGRQEEARQHLEAHGRGGGPPTVDDPLMEELRRKVAPSYLIVQNEVRRLASIGRPEEALDLLKRSMATDVTGVTARKQLGEVLGQMGRFQESAAAYREVLAVAPGDHEARTFLGRALEGAGQTKEAEAAYRQVLERHPRYAPALVFLGRLLCRSGRAGEGLPVMERGIRERPGEGEYRYLLGVELARAGRNDRALEELETGAALLPGHAGLRYTLGQLRLAGGDAAGAAAAWEEAVALAPGLAEAWIGLARIDLSRGDADRAVERAEQGCRITGFKVARHLEVLARAYEAAGRSGEAAEIRRRAAAPSR